MAAGSWYLVVPQAGTNLCSNPSSEDNAGTYTPLVVGTALAQSLAQARWGVASVAVTPAAGGYAGLLDAVPGATPGVTYTFSIWVRGAAGVPYRIYFGDAAGNVAAGCTPTTFVATGAWERHEVTHVAAAALLYACVTKNNAASVAVFYVDGWQVEAGAAATTYLDGNQPGCEWLGQPELSASARAAHAGAGGVIVDLADYDISITTVAGLGMPPLQGRVTATPNLPGAQLQDQHVEPRVITLACWAQGATATGLDRAREQLLHALKPDRVATIQPVSLRYETASGRLFELHAYYDAGLEGNWSEYRFERFPLRLLCYDPYCYEIGEEAAALDVNASALWRYVGARLRATGQWDALGPPAAGGAVHALCIARDGTLFVGGDFVSWDGVVGNDYLVMWDGAAWQNVGGAGAFNAPVYALMMSADPRILIVGGGFDNAGGIGAADYVCTYDLDAGILAALSGGGTGPVHALALASNGDLYLGGDFDDWNALAAADNIVMWDVSAGAYAAVGNGLDDQVQTLVVSRRADYLYAGGLFHNDGTPLPMLNIARWDGTSWTAVGGGLDDGLGAGDVAALALDSAGDLYAGGSFTRTADGAITDLNNIARWDGQTWQPLQTGTQGRIYSLAMGPDNILHVGGAMTAAGELTVVRYARWNGTAWLPVDVYLPSGVVTALATGRPDPVVTANYDVFLGLNTTDTMQYAGAATATNTGSARAYPYIWLQRTGGTNATLRMLRNEANGQELLFDSLELLDGETIYIDCRPGQRRVYSDRRANLLGYMVVPANLAAFYLEPATELRSGANTITALLTEGGAPTIRAALIWTRTDWSVDPA